MSRGRPRKPAGRQTRPNRYRHEIPPVAIVSASPQPDLPPMRDWQAVTLEWWQAWRESDYAGYLTAVDWEQLIIAASLHDSVAVLGEMRYAAELRTAQKQVIDRAEARMAQGAVKSPVIEEMPGEVPEPKAIEGDRQKVSQEHWDLMNKTIPENLLHERFEVISDD